MQKAFKCIPKTWLKDMQTDMGVSGLLADIGVSGPMKGGRGESTLKRAGWSQKTVELGRFSANLRGSWLMKTAEPIPLFKCISKSCVKYRQTHQAFKCSLKTCL